MKDNHWNMPANKKMALFIAKKQLVSLVHDAVKLEGINFTIPEVQTLLEGITVGGHKLSDQTIAVNQGKAWEQLFDWLKQDLFVLSKERACNLHAIAGKEEAMEWGVFRTGQVFISGTDYAPPHHSELDGLFSKLIGEILETNDVYYQQHLGFRQ